MKAIYNSRIIDQEDIQISTNNRAFCYGDGLFETIVTGPNRINLIDEHIDRLKADCDVLRLEFPKEIEVDFNSWIDQLSQLNGLTGDVRIKINVWRKEGGLYTPTNHNCEYLITAKDSTTPIFRSKRLIGIAKTVSNQLSIHSKIKSINSLNYILAGIEKNERDLNEIIILDNEGHLSETHIGNLFWIKNGRFYTPSIETGCIKGIMRGFLIQYLDDAVEVVKAKPQSLFNADCIFSSNASGIEYYDFLEETNLELSSPRKFLDSLIKRLQQP